MLRVETDFIQSDLRFSKWDAAGIFGITTEHHSAALYDVTCYLPDQ